MRCSGGYREVRGGAWYFLDRCRCGGGRNGDDHSRAALPGLYHAVFGILQSTPKPAWARLSPLEAPNRKPTRHQMHNIKLYHFHEESFGQIQTSPIQDFQNSVLVEVVLRVLGFQKDVGLVGVGCPEVEVVKVI